jgi:hypothetical protein
MGSGTNFITLDNTGFYSSFRDLSFVNFATQTSNYVIECANDVNVEIYDCFFTGASNWSGVIDFTGTDSGNGAIIKNVYIANFANTAINVASALDTMYIEDLEILGGNVSTNIGINCTNGGAMLLADCQIIKCGINMQLNPGSGLTVSAVFGVNCFFDQGVLQSLNIVSSTSGTVFRTHFVGSWFTVSTGGANCQAIAITSSGAAIHSGIEFQNCWIMNASPGSTGTLTGVLVTGASDFTVSNCQIAGWTSGITVTPPTTAGVCQPTIVGNNIAAAGGIWQNSPTNTIGNVTGITLNAGAPTTYGNINIQSNTFAYNTTNISDSSTNANGTEKTIRNNPGNGRDVISARATSAGQTIISTTMTAVTGLTFPIVQPSLAYSFEAQLPNIAVSTTSSVAVGVAISVPPAATLTYSVFGNSTATTVFKNVYVTSTVTTAAQAGTFLTYGSATGGGMLQIKGVVAITATATSNTGSVQVMLGAAGSTATSPNSLVISAGSWINAYKVT